MITAKSGMCFFSQKPIQHTVHTHQVHNHNPTNIWQVYVAGQKKQIKTNSKKFFWPNLYPFLSYHLVRLPSLPLPSLPTISWSSSNFMNLASQTNAWNCVCLLWKLCMTSLEQSLHHFAGEIGPWAKVLLSLIYKSSVNTVLRMRKINKIILISEYYYL